MADNLKDLNKLLKETIGLLKQLSPAISSVNSNGGGGGGGAGGGGQMDGSLSKVNTVAGGWSQTVSKTFSGIGSVIKGAAAMGGGVAQALPDLALTIGREAGYYGAGVMSGGIMNRNALQSNVRLGLGQFTTSAGSDANVAAIMTGRGMVPGTAAFNRTVTGTAQLARYMNMPNEVAAGALENLGSGATSGKLMSNFGIFTSNPNTGQEMSQGQIFEQMARRIYANGQGDSANTMQDIRRGFAGSAITNSGLDPAQQEMFKAFLVERAKGNYLDVGNKSAMDKVIGSNAKKGYENPFLSAYKVNSAETRNMETATKEYVQGLKEASEAVVQFKNFINDSMINNPGLAKTNALIQVLAGDKGFQGLTAVITGAITGISGILSTILGLKALKALTAAKTGAVAVTAAKTASKFIKGTPILNSVLFASEVGLRSLDKTPLTKAEKAGYQHQGIPGDQGSMYIPSSGSASDPLGLKTDSSPAGKSINSIFNSQPKSTPKRKVKGGPTSTVRTGTTTSTNGSKSLKLMAPVKGPVTCKFGTVDAMHPNGHNGTDFGVPEGTPVSAAGDGVVKGSYWSDAIGNVVEIDHGNNYSTLYAHLKQSLVSPGVEVQMGNIIAYSGNTGKQTTGAHLHFEVRKNGQSISPAPFLGAAAAITAGNWTSTDSSNMLSGAGSVSAGAVAGQLSGSYSTPDMNDYSPTTGSGSIPSAYSGAAIASANSSGDSTSLSIGRAPSTANASVGTISNQNTGGGEMVLKNVPVMKTSQQYSEERSKVVHEHKNTVTINLTVPNTSEPEARKFVDIIKRELEHQAMIDRMQRH
jgi:hypothetical protein